jgi:hypothetical protein
MPPDEDLYERDIPQSKRDELPAEDFAGKHKSFPIARPSDVAAAAASIGRAGSDNYSTDELKARIIAIAKRKGAAYEAQLPDAWKPKSKESADDEWPPDIVQISEVAGVSVSELQDAVRVALREKHPRVDAYVWIAELYDDHVVYEVNPRNRLGDETGRTRYYSAPYTMETLPVVKAAVGEAVEVVRKITFVPVNNNVAGESQAEAELSSELTDLIESAAGASKREVKIISPGWGSSGYYSPEVLKRDGPAAFAAGTHTH